MATSGTYVTEVTLQGSAEKHYKTWKNQSLVFPEAIGHHIQNVTIHEGEHDSHGSVRTLNYTHEDWRVTLWNSTRCVTLLSTLFPKLRIVASAKLLCYIWEKRNDDFPEPSGYMKLVKNVVVDLEGHVTKA